MRKVVIAILCAALGATNSGLLAQTGSMRLVPPPASGVTFAQPWRPAGLTGDTMIIGTVVDRAIFRSENGNGIGFFVVTMIAQVVLGIGASMIVMWFSRHREFRADAAGAQLAGRENMIGALERLKVATKMPETMPETLVAFGISSGTRQGLSALFASHPPLDTRIAALRAA